MPTLDDLAERDASQVAPKRWEELQLHAWLTIAILYGERRPEKCTDRIFSDVVQRRRQIRAMPCVAEDGVREVIDVFGSRLIIDNGIVEKMLGDSYRGRVPYLRWACLAPTRAVEVWRRIARSKVMAAEVAREYCLVPIQGDSSYDGYAVIVENGRIFNLLLFRSSYADATLRDGVLLYKSYPDGLLCTSGCCKALATERRELGILRDENRRLKLQLRDERKAAKRLKSAPHEFERTK